MVSRSLALATCAVLACLPAGAQEGLYSDRLPGDATLVRVMNATAQPAEAALATTRFGPVEPWSVSPYQAVTADLAILTVSGRRVEVILRPGTFLTVVVLDTGPQLFEDERHTDAARAQLVLYNLSDQGAGLYAAPAVAVIPPVEPGRSGSVVVNAVRAALRVAAEGEAAGPGLPAEIDITMRRGGSYSVFVLPAAAPSAVLVAEAEVAED